MVDKVKGVAPGFLLMPAKEYEWEVQDRIEIRVPMSGKISELFDEKIPTVSTEDDDFSVFEDDLLLLWEVVRVLFAKARYPRLEKDQCLNVVAMEFKDNEVILHGEIIRSVG